MRPKEANPASFGAKMMFLERGKGGEERETIAGDGWGCITVSLCKRILNS